MLTRYGLGEEPTILADVVVSSLYQAGLRRDDVIKAVNSLATRPGKNTAGRLLRFLAEASCGSLAEVIYEREG